MASHDPAPLAPARDRAEGQERKAFDKSQNAPVGSISLVLLVAAALIAAAGGLIYVGRDYVEAYVLTLLAALGTNGGIAVFCVPCRILKVSGKDHGKPLLKSTLHGA